MSTKCGRCDKTVYPTETLKCLDKTWHKGCFKCKECGMTLNMKNYKGYNKEPYCSAHYPTTKFTAVADTPEARRLADNTKIQSNVQYHAEFEKQKGRKIDVTDDPELLRHQKNTAIMSNVSYHGVLEQKEGQEKRRQTLGELDEASLPAQSAPEHVSPQHVQQDPRGAGQPSPAVHQGVLYAQHQASPVQQSPQYQQQQRLSQQYNNVQSQRHDSGGYAGTPNGNSQVRSGGVQQQPHHQQPPPTQMQQQYYQKQPPQQLQQHSQQQQSYQYSARSGNVGAGGGGGGGVPASNGAAAPQGVTSGPPPSLPRPEGRVYKAVYDYQAQDDDEIGFFEGDLIINCEPIDEGWMQGMHKKSGQVGMLPANYVELVL